MKNSPTDVNVPIPANVPASFLSRICDFYLAQPQGPEMSPLWQGIVNTWCNSLQLELQSRSLAGIQNRLEKIHTGMLCWGIDDWIERGPEHHIATWIEHLRSLARSLGLLSVGRNDDAVDAVALVDQIEAALGFRFNTAGNGSTFGPIINGRCIPYKLLQAACIWVEVVRVSRVMPSVLLELGAGLGSFGHILGLLSSAAAKRIDYHTVDLPIVAVQHAYLLGANFGERSIWLEGEPANPEAQFHIHGLSTQGVPTVGVVINNDSLPEIPKTAASRYVSMITDKLTPGGYFVSTNQESGADGIVESTDSGQTRVFDLVKDEKHLRQTFRAPWWARTNYVLEIFQKTLC